MTNNINPIKYSDRLCFKCLKDFGCINRYTICNRGYGSKFDNLSTVLQLCDKCDYEDIRLWVDETPKLKDGYCEEYKYECNLSEFIKNLPIQGRELFENQCADGSSSCLMDSQDWIDTELNIASDKVYEKYGMYSPKERY